MARKVALGVMLEAGNGRRTSAASSASNRVLPHDLVGDVISRRGSTSTKSVT